MPVDPKLEEIHQLYNKHEAHHLLWFMRAMGSNYYAIVCQCGAGLGYVHSISKLSQAQADRYMSDIKHGRYWHNNFSGGYPVLDYTASVELRRAGGSGKLARNGSLEMP